MYCIKSAPDKAHYESSVAGQLEQEHIPMMKALQRANINAFISALIWGLVMSFVIKVSFSSLLTNQRLLSILQYGGVFLYPVLASIIVRKKTELWLNPCFFSLIGGVASFLSLDLVSGFQNKVWTNIVFLFVFFVMVLFSIPKIGPALQHDWNSPFWEKLNQSPFIEFLFLQFHSIDNNAG
jgi:hypothetical protein